MVSVALEDGGTLAVVGGFWSLRSPNPLPSETIEPWFGGPLGSLITLVAGDACEPGDGDDDPAAFFEALPLPVSFGVVAPSVSGLEMPKMRSLAAWYRASRSWKDSPGDAVCFTCAGVADGRLRMRIGGGWFNRRLGEVTGAAAPRDITTLGMGCWGFVFLCKSNER